jgi:hypothetical protein
MVALTTALCRLLQREIRRLRDATPLPDSRICDANKAKIGRRMSPKIGLGGLANRAAGRCGRL